MDINRILDPLNEIQREAVSTPSGHTLVLAGAGSGKTRVLVHRIAWLLENDRIPPRAIFAVTFTNKAAMEMRSRIEAMLERSLGAMWVGTFHGLAHRMLRLHWRDTDLPEGFQILDSEDQLRMIRRVIRNMSLDETKWQPKQAQWFINAKKDEGLRPQHVDDVHDEEDNKMREIYQAYHKDCQRSGLVDFAELLLKAHELLRERDDLLAHYRGRFSHLLVDELQDTNAVQYAWIRLIAGDSGQLFMVGDDDQSIYGWRGARIENIHRFSRDFPDVRTFRLEQNYRSTGNILAAANAVIANNKSRLGKNLWTSDVDGEPIHLYVAFNEREEAAFVVDRIRQWVLKQGRRDDIAILYRVSAQSRVFEERLLATGIPYRVHGGLRFYERAEIKDALAYLRLMVNHRDDAAFERVVNQPPRGIGARTLELLRQKARVESISLWAAAQSLLAQGEFPSRAGGAISAFLRLIDSLAEPLSVPASSQKPLHEIVDDTIKKSGLLLHYKTDKSDRSETRVENLGELVSAVRQFGRETNAQDEEPNQDEETESMATFLAHATLESGETQGEEDCVHLMSFHAAKGLEFPMVFLCGLEENLFPHQRNVSNPQKLEEERRLCYVGMTRARQHLYISHAEKRRLHGADYQQRPSRFIQEIPPALIREVMGGTGTGTMATKGAKTAQRPNTPKSSIMLPSKPRTQPLPLKSAAASDTRQWPPGQRVAHPTFGEGVIQRYEGDGKHTRVEVNFSQGGSKWLILNYAKLQTI
uniref:DNA 3'-5' helicase n=1 Tax=Candidatus Kentrum sp. MB TaxID=2138164 RepID=A0A451BD54_9GAMM|nr:MAG: ATP-dependent DNA helicase UvrD [Candidatus Kentron sp. MB]VFK34039.1 MAG: ATP-dependent DNA helicase UvrD [Candidatus Kentron sp. MB]VFK76210.1 MAG: ATP-dependent DNA helicase UvrD [Candidatus Kentron sp. MB]